MKISVFLQNMDIFHFRDAFFIEQLALAQPALFSSFFRLNAKCFKLDSYKKPNIFTLNDKNDCDQMGGRSNYS